MEGICGFFEPIFGDSTKTVAIHSESWREKKEPRLSPFTSSEGSYRWPNLYDEVDEMIESCILIYLLVEIRRQARKGELETGSKRVLAMPIRHEKIVSIVQANRENLVGHTLNSEFYQDVLESIVSRKNAAKVCPSQIMHVDDEFERDELVYMIEVDHRRKRITVCFRGSNTKKDWETNFEYYMKERKNPVKGGSQEPTVRVHNGFYKYLFGPSYRGTRGPNGECLSECHEIVHEHLLKLIKAHKEYKIYVTGHSLGGALATLFAFELAAAPDKIIPKPVSLFSVASPYVGDYSFRSAHQRLERLGKLRHLRLTNHKDYVPLIPKFSFRWNIFDREASVGSSYKHVGINLRLFNGSESFEISFPKVDNGVLSGLLDEFARGWDQMFASNLTLFGVRNHLLKEYCKRLDASQPSVEAVHLNELYSRVDVVGQLVPQF